MRDTVKKVVLAYSGGLDTSVILRWLQDTYRCDVVTFTADLGQGEELDPARRKAEMLGALEIFEPERSEWKQRNAGRQSVIRQICDRAGGDDLAAMRSPKQPRNAVHGRSKIVAAAFHRFAGVHCHADVQPFDARPIASIEFALSMHRCIQGVVDRRKCDAKCVADCLKDLSVVPEHRRMHHAVVPTQRLGHLLGFRFPTGGAAFDV